MNLELVDPFELHSELPEVIEAKLEDGDVAVCAFNRRGNLLAGGCTDGKVLIWDFDTHGVSRTFEGHTKSVTAIAWTRSSRRLFSASADGTLLVWEVLTGNRLAQVDLGVPVHLAVLHPRNRDLCLACVQAQGAPGAIYLQHLRKPEQRTSLLPAETADDAASSANAKRGAAVACFDQTGERVLMATARGVVHVASVPGGELLATVQVPGGAAVKSISMGRNGRTFIVLSADRTVRLYMLDRVLEGATSPLRELQDVINRVQWTHASLTSGSEHVIASSASQTEQQLYVWDLHGHLTKTLEGPKDGATSFVCHPSRPILACCSRSGALYLWSKLYSENWSAFAPDFKELEENEEYEEREDEFDNVEVTHDKKVEDDKKLIDIVTRERSEVAHVPDADDDDEELLFIPTHPEPDEEGDEGGGGGEGDEVDSSVKANKRKPATEGGKPVKRAA
mmetsp:Transcript_20529/g.48716  ORF Transcript_20529/g.48716 Transcript_20529/m.48716 type:complete len:451 (+) Transcript_20529:114-1466(+)